LKILPSQWQESIQAGASYSYEEWLGSTLRYGPYKPTSKFWRRHRHDTLVERWGSVVGLDNITVVVVDDADPPRLLRAFEELVGLPSGLLVPEARIANRSLTLGEVELMRRFNVELEKCSWLSRPQRKVIRESVRRSMRKGYTPSPDEARIITPEWAVAAAAEVAREMTENISKLGVRVIGDLSLLTWTPHGTAKVADLPRVLSFVAADAVLGAVLATWPPKASPLPDAAGDRPVRKVRSLDLLRVVGRRALRRVPRQLRRRRATAGGDLAAGGR